MFNAFLTMIGVLIDVLVSVAKKLVGLVLLGTLIAVSTLITLVIVLTHIMR